MCKKVYIADVENNCVLPVGVQGGVRCLFFFFACHSHIVGFWSKSLVPIYMGQESRRDL